MIRTVLYSGAAMVLLAAIMADQSYCLLNKGPYCGIASIAFGVPAILLLEMLAVASLQATRRARKSPQGKAHRPR